MSLALLLAEVAQLDNEIQCVQNSEVKFGHHGGGQPRIATMKRPPQFGLWSTWCATIYISTFSKQVGSSKDSTLAALQESGMWSIPSCSVISLAKKNELSVVEFCLATSIFLVIFVCQFCIRMMSLGYLNESESTMLWREASLIFKSALLLVGLLCQDNWPFFGDTVVCIRSSKREN